MALQHGRSNWEDLATEALRAFVRARGAVLRPEAEAWLGELGWIHDHYDPAFPRDRGPNPHHLTTAFQRLELAAEIQPDTATLQGRQVTAYLDSAALASGQATAIRQTAAAKRRRYRSYLGWAGNSKTCGEVAERIVFASMQVHKGSKLWIPPSIKPGRVTKLLNRPIKVGGPLDVAGHWVEDPEDPSRGVVPFAVEVKNIRSWIYPWDHEVWDLLSKLGDFPEVVPVLVARRIHPITFNMFLDIGALGTQTGSQWFSNPGTQRASIDEDRFGPITSELGFHDATLVPDPDTPVDRLSRWFADTATKPLSDSFTLSSRALGRWRQTAPLVGEARRLRDALSYRERRTLWEAFCERVVKAGLYERGGWAPKDFDA